MKKGQQAKPHEARKAWALACDGRFILLGGAVMCFARKNRATLEKQFWNQGGSQCGRTYRVVRVEIREIP